MYVSCKPLHIADPLSRAYVTETGDPLVDEDLSLNLIDIILVSSQKVDIIQLETSNVPTLQTLLDVVMNGWHAERRQAPHCICGMRMMEYYIVVNVSSFPPP